MKLNLCAVDIVSCQCSATQLTNQVQSCQVLWPQAWFASTSSYSVHTNWTSEQDAESEGIAEDLSTLGGRGRRGKRRREREEGEGGGGGGGDRGVCKEGDKIWSKEVNTASDLLYST